MTALENVTVTVNGTVCRILFGRYADGDRTAIRLVDVATGEPYATATMNLPEDMWTYDEVAIKDHSENVGVLEALVAAGIVKPTGRKIITGHVSVPVCSLLRTPADW